MTLSFNLRPGVALGDATAEVQRMATRILPATISTGFSGTAQAFQDTQAGMLALLGIAIFVIYIVLGILYESFIHPITILSGLPFAAFGALLTLLIFHIDLSVYAFVGIILLVGLVKKNAIMMIDFALESERTEGTVAVGSDRPRLFDPLPPDHDDDDGGAHGHVADCTGARARARSRAVHSASRWSAVSPSRRLSRSSSRP